MKKLVVATLGAMTLGGLVAAAPLALAQPAHDAPHMSQSARKLPSERIDARLAYAKTALKITPAQEAQWNVLAEVLRKHAKAMDQRVTERRAERENRDRDRSVTAIERLERRQELMASAATRMTEVLEAAKPLYAVLSDEQKKDADALLSRGGRRHGHFGGQRH